MSGGLSACLERLAGKGEGEGSEKGESDSSSSSEETQDRDNTEAMRRVDRLERELAVNPLLYDKHIELISMLGGMELYV